MAESISQPNHSIRIVFDNPDMPQESVDNLADLIDILLTELNVDAVIFVDEMRMAMEAGHEPEL